MMDKETLKAISDSRITVEEAAKRFRRMCKAVLTAEQAATNF